MENIIQNAKNNPVFDWSFFKFSFYGDKVGNLWHTIQTSQIWEILHIISYILTLFGITITIYCIVRIFEIQKEEHSHLRHEIHEAMSKQYEESLVGKNPRWENILNLSNSSNTSDWRLAIIEADAILDGLLLARGLSGANMGERLKNISPGDLGSIQAAWEAHLVRNQIAHQGTEYVLSQRDVRRTLQLYEVVFRELGFLQS